MVEFEITKSCLAHDSEKFIATLKSYKCPRVLTAMDDLGTALLKSFPVDCLNLLREMGCDEVQGCFFSMPVPVSDFEQLLQR